MVFIRTETISSRAASMVSLELLQMNRDALAALVTLGAKAGDPMRFIVNQSDRFTVSQMLARATL